MAIIAIGDVHLRAGDRRNTARLSALNQIVQHARALGDELHAVIWLGDIYDRESGIDDRNVIAGYVQLFGGMAPQVIVRGNHDRPGDLDILGELATRYPVTVVTRPKVVYLPHGNTTFDRYAVACLPYPDKGGLVAADVPASAMADAVNRGLDAVFAELGHELTGAIVPTIFAGHITVGGAETSVGQPLIGHDVQITAAHLMKLPEKTVKILGHIHKPQELLGAHYVGSVSPCDWGETERKRFFVLRRGPNPLTGEGPVGWQIEHRLIDVPALYHVEGVFDGTAVTWVVKRGPDGPIEGTPPSFRGAEVRVRYRFNASDAGRVAVCKAQLLADFAEAAHVELEPVAIPDRSVRAPEIARATSTADKLAEWCRLAGLATTDGVLAKLAELERPDRDALLVALEARLTQKGAAA